MCLYTLLNIKVKIYVSVHIAKHQVKVYVCLYTLSNIKLKICVYILCQTSRYRYIYLYVSILSQTSIRVYKWVQRIFGIHHSSKYFPSFVGIITNLVNLFALWRIKQKNSRTFVKLTIYAWGCGHLYNGPKLEKIRALQ